VWIFIRTVKRCDSKVQAMRAFLCKSRADSWVQRIGRNQSRKACLCFRHSTHVNDDVVRKLNRQNLARKQAAPRTSSTPPETGASGSRRQQARVRDRRRSRLCARGFPVACVEALASLASAAVVWPFWRRGESPKLTAYAGFAPPRWAAQIRRTSVSDSETHDHRTSEHH
jgi:hypothetical protein